MFLPFRNADLDVVPEDKNKFIQVIRPLLVELVSQIHRERNCAFLGAYLDWYSSIRSDWYVGCVFKWRGYCCCSILWSGFDGIRG